MSSKSPNWGLEIGCQSKIKPHNPNIALSAHGLSGKKSEGELSYSREMTRRVARQDARDGIPVSEAATPAQWSEREQQIATEAEDLRRGLHAWFTASAAAVRNYIQDCTPMEIEPEALREAIKAEENDYRHYEADDAMEAKAAHDATVVELSDFKTRHQARIGSRTPDIKKNVEQTVAILMFMLILEGCFNALLFKDAQANGLLGGMLVAFGVSAVNVICGVCAGYLGLRFLNHPATAFKVAGGIAAGIFLTFGLFLNLFVAHFRDAVEFELHARTAAGSLTGFSMFDIPPGDVIKNMFPNIVGLDSMVAFGLLFIGLGVFCLSVYEGYDKISDRYPGYGRVWRKERAAYEKRQEVRNSLREDLGDYYTNCRAWFDRQQIRHTEAKREIEKSINWLETRREKAMMLASRTGDQERNLKVAYRQAHRRERNNNRDTLGEQAAVPMYFDEIVTPNIPDFEYARERDQADSAIRTIELNLKALTATRQWLDTHIQSVQRGLSSVEKKVEQFVEESRQERGGAPSPRKSA